MHKKILFVNGGKVYRSVLRNGYAAIIHEDENEVISLEFTKEELENLQAVIGEFLSRDWA